MRKGGLEPLAEYRKSKAYARRVPGRTPCTPLGCPRRGHGLGRRIFASPARARFTQLASGPSATPRTHAALPVRQPLTMRTKGSARFAPTGVLALRVHFPLNHTPGPPPRHGPTGRLAHASVDGAAGDRDHHEPRIGSMRTNG